tara:strand:- start:217 stop:639 length:423 start_codon:yes stop_codon:yes gene_type:complete
MSSETDCCPLGIPLELKEACQVDWSAAEDLQDILCKLLRPGGPPEGDGDVELARVLDEVLSPIVLQIAKLKKAVIKDEPRSVRALTERYEALSRSYDELLELFYITEKDVTNLIEVVKEAGISLPEGLGCDFDGEPVGVN